MNNEPAKRLTNYASRRDGSGVSAGKVIGIGLGVLAALAFAANLKDILRYIKIANM